MTKIAIVHDSLCGTGGAEKVFKAIAESFPSADIFTLAYNPESVDSYFQERVIKTTILNPLFRGMELVRWLYPINTYLMSTLPQFKRVIIQLI